MIYDGETMTLQDCGMMNLRDVLPVKGENFNSFRFFPPLRVKLLLYLLKTFTHNYGIWGTRM